MTPPRDPATTWAVDRGSSPTISGGAPPQVRDSRADQPPPPAIDGFRVVERIGRGGMGEVYKARDVQLDRVVAAKVLRRDGTVASDYGAFLGEALARYYFDKYGVETAVVRIGSCFPEPKDHRMLVTWLSEDDLVALVRDEAS